jgi:histidine triad (HIT) family protein
MNCIFCKIINKQAEAEVIFEDEKVISFLDINPFNFGHTLVIPKNHYEDFLSVPSDLLGDLIRATKEISLAVKSSLNADGINIIANNGKAAGQTVFHFHFHIIPRFKDDKFVFHRNLKRYEADEKRIYGEKIRLEVNK